MNSPDILFDLKAHQFLDKYDTNNKTQKESAFFHCQNSYDPINYYTRKGASEQEDFDTIKAMEQLNAQTNMSDKDIISYASDRPGSTGLWDRKGDITAKAQLKDIRSKLRDHKSTVWSSVVCFTPEYAEKQKQEAEILNMKNQIATITQTNANLEKMMSEILQKLDK